VFVLLGKFEDAIEEIEKAELYEPFNPELLLLKGETLLNYQNFEEAEICFAKALEHTDERVDMLFEIAYVYQDCDMYGKAIEYFNIIISENPEIEQAYYEAANCYDVLGQTEKSLSFYNTLIKYRPL
jgi:tetratricopeptide (TPR) repeat protein